MEQTLDRVGVLCAQRHALDIELCARSSRCLPTLVTRKLLDFVALLSG